MIVFKPKNRVLTLRISDDEYHVLRQASLRDGSRSLSDYARDSLFRESRPAPVAVSPELETRMAEFAVEIDSLSHALRHLRAQMAAKPGISE